MKRIRNEFNGHCDKLQVFSSDKQIVQKGSIISKIDWFTVVFFDCTVFDALSSLTFQKYEASDDFDRVYSDRFFSSQGYLPDVVFNFDGIVLKIAYNDILTVGYRDQIDVENIDAYSFFDLTFRKIRCDISGTGLDRLREKGVDVDTLYFRPLPCSNDGMTYHVTRCDVAFDLLDTMSDFLMECMYWCDENGNRDTQRIAVGDSRGIKYSMRTGDQTTLYLGAASSDKLLRIYDKGYQYEHCDKVVPYVYQDGDIPSSWIRIELQCRREQTTHHILYDHSDFEDSIDCFLAVFRYIYDKFGFYKDGKTVDIWTRLFDWDKIPSLLQKSYFVQSSVSSVDRAHTYVFSSAFKSICILAANFGWESLIQEFNTRFYNLQTSSIPQDKSRFNSLMIHILDNRDHLPLFIHRLPNGKYTIGNML